MIKKILFLLTFLLTTLGGGKLWAAEETYNVSGNTGSNTINTASGTTTFEESTFNFWATSSVNLSVNGGSSYWTLASDKITGNDISASITITPSKGGLLVVNLVKNSGNNKYLYVFVNGTAQSIKEVKEGNSVIAYGQNNKTGYNITGTSNSNVVATIQAVAGTTYRFSFENSKFNDWSFTGFTFTPAETTINISDLNYSVGTGGKSDAGLNRTVGGFDLSFTNGGSGQGIKYNGGSSFFFRKGVNGTMTIAMDGNNSSISITQIVLTISSSTSYDNPASYFGVNTGSLTKNSNTQLTWTGPANSVTFTHPSASEEVHLSSIVITTTTTPTYSKITPTLTISNPSENVYTGVEGHFQPTITSNPANFNWNWTNSNSADIVYWTKVVKNEKKSQSTGDPGTFDTSTSTLTTGVNTMTATYTAGDNPWFNDAGTSHVYTLNVLPRLSWGSLTKQDYPHTWDFTTFPSYESELAFYTGDWTPAEDVATSHIYIQSWPTDYDGNYPVSFDNITPLKGLKFAKQGALWPDCSSAYHYLFIMDGPVITIPEVKKGQKVRVWGYARRSSDGAKITDQVISATNTTVASVGPDDDDYFDFVAAEDGDVVLSFPTTEGKNWFSLFSISVLKTAITRFNFMDGDANPTTYDYDSNNPTFSPVLIIEPSGAASNNSLFTVTNSTNTEVIAIANSGCSSITNTDNINFANSLQRKKPGTSTVTFSFAGNDAYEPATFTATYTINKQTPAVTFAKGTNQTIPFTTGSYTDVATATMGRTVTYASSDERVATVSDAGVVMFHNSGVTKITATAVGDDYYNEASANYTLTVTGSKTPTLKWTATNNGDTYTVANLPYGNSQSYTAAINNTDGSDVDVSDIRYGVVEAYEGYLTVGATDGKIQPTRKFADENLEYIDVQVYAYTPSSGDRNASPRILYNVRIVKGTFANEFFKQKELTVNVGCTIAPKNNLQSLRWEDISAIRVEIKEGNSNIAVSGPGTDMVTDYKADTSNKTLYFDTKTKDDVEIVDWFYPVFHGKAVGKVTFTVTLQSKLYGDHTGEFTLHVIPTNQHTVLAWAEGTKPKYTIYEGDYMLLPEVTGSTNGNFSYSVGAANQSTHHKYVYSRRWNSGTEKYETIYNNKNFHKGEGFPNFDLTEDAEGNTPVPEVKADGSDVALLFWNTGQGTENDHLLIYANKPGTVYLKASDPQVDRSLSTIEIEVKSRSAIDADFGSLKSSMTFPYTWDFTTNYDWSKEIETGTGNWIQDGSTYDLGMSSNINYDYADEDKDGKVWGNDNDDPTTDSNALTDKLLVGKEDKVLRGFAGMKIRLGNNGTGSWYSKRDGIHILPYSNSEPGAPRLRVTTGTHTLILPTPTGSNCPETFKVFVKAKALEAGEGTLWVRDASLARDDKGQNKYHDFKSTSAGEDIIYSVDASRDTPLELDLDKVDVYWIAYSTEAKDVARPAINSSLSYAAASYSYPKALDLSKSAEVNSGVTAYYASDYAYNKDAAATNTEGYAVVLTAITSPVPANTGLVLMKNTTDVSTSCYMIADGENELNYVAPSEFPSALGTNYLKATSPSGKTVGSNETISGTTYTNFAMAYAYKMYHDPMNPGSVYTDYLFDRDWSFYKIMGDVSISNKKSYLQIPGNLYVDRDGKIQGASRRAADDNRPSTKPMLDIIFEDEPSGDHNVTGITSVSDRIIDNDAWYTLQGIRVDAPAKGGIYIHNGRKVVIK